MLLSDFRYDLPPALVAQFPLAERTASRLLQVNPKNGQLYDRQFSDLLELIAADDLLVFNDTRVIPARLFGQKLSGGKLEVLVERVLSGSEFIAQLRCNRTPKVGSKFLLLDGDEHVRVELIERQGCFFRLRLLCDRSVLDVCDALGHMPLPPYIERADEVIDNQRYQTVYGHVPGAVAAPTAGLHFDDQMLSAIRAKGVQSAYVTLHVGAGTFQPVRVADINQHDMHSEFVEVTQATCDLVRQTQQRGGRVIAVGTTSVRCLESAAQSGALRPFKGETKLFIKPGDSFAVVDALLTNFHMPESTLLMLVSAFGGYDLMMSAYRHAVAQQYRFFSYGDAMFIENKFEPV